VTILLAWLYGLEIVALAALIIFLVGMWWLSLFGELRRIAEPAATKAIRVQAIVWGGGIVLLAGTIVLWIFRLLFFP